jgi:hypothetical protein
MKLNIELIDKVDIETKVKILRNIYFLVLNISFLSNKLLLSSIILY